MEMVGPPGGGEGANRARYSSKSISQSGNSSGESGGKCWKCDFSPTRRARISLSNCLTECSLP